MFAIAAPQTVTLITPGGDGQPISLTFHTGTDAAPDDVSRCVVDVLMPNGDVHVATFSVRGQLVDVQFIEYHEPDATTEREDDGEEIQADEGPYHASEQAGEVQPA